jgi:hypothetical protein
MERAEESSLGKLSTRAKEWNPSRSSTTAAVTSSAGALGTMTGKEGQDRHFHYGYASAVASNVHGNAFSLSSAAADIVSGRSHQTILPQGITSNTSTFANAAAAANNSSSSLYASIYNTSNDNWQQRSDAEKFRSDERSSSSWKW